MEFTLQPKRFTSVSLVNCFGLHLTTNRALSRFFTDIMHSEWSKIGCSNDTFVYKKSPAAARSQEIIICNYLSNYLESAPAISTAIAQHCWALLIFFVHLPYKLLNTAIPWDYLTIYGGLGDVFLFMLSKAVPFPNLLGIP